MTQGCAILRITPHSEGGVWREEERGEGRERESKIGKARERNRGWS